MALAVIGGAGFVGTRLAEVLERENVDFQILDKKLEGAQYVDVTRPETLAALKSASVVINLAAEHRDDVMPKSLYDDVNVEGSRNICDFCRAHKISTIIFTSSVAVYGFAPEGTDESGAINYFNDYGRTKHLAECVYREWYEEDTETRNLVIVRPTVIFGEGNRGNVYNLLKQIASGKFMMFGNGKNRKSMAYVQNIAEFLNFSTSLRGYCLYNYIDKPDLDMNTLIATVRSTLFNKDNVGLRLPAFLGYFAGYGFDLLAFVLRRNLPISSIRVKKFMVTTAFTTNVHKSGFVPTTTIEEGLEKTLRYEFLEDNSEKITFVTE
jgi:nucleoside-diphosphate-sugar epimerase